MQYLLNLLYYQISYYYYTTLIPAFYNRAIVGK